MEFSRIILASRNGIYIGVDKRNFFFVKRRGMASIPIQEMLRKLKMVNETFLEGQR